jgi:hypothetical protein
MYEALLLGRPDQTKTFHVKRFCLIALAAPAPQILHS